MISDKVSLAYLMDVIVFEVPQKRGQKLLEYIFSHSQFKTSQLAVAHK